MLFDVDQSIFLFCLLAWPSNILIAAGFWLLALAWKVLFEAQRQHKLATTGPYARVRHPLYAGFVLIMTGFLLQWPTLITAVMFPILVFMYVRLAMREEHEAFAEFGEQYSLYATKTPRFSQHIRSLPTKKALS